MARFFDLPEGCIPGDHARQMTSWTMADQVCGVHPEIENVLDLGCGKGDSIDYFRRKSGRIKWVGVDIEGSPEVRTRTRGDAEFRTFDGIHIPAERDSADMVFCKQVFEHVRYPAELLKEVARVLRPGGHFVGSTSQLECYHSFSYWNYTLFGFNSLLDDAGLRIIQFRPSIDGLTLIGRRLLPFRRFFDRFWESESPYNRLIGFRRRMKKRPVEEINAEKLLTAGQFCFWVTRK